MMKILVADDSLPARVLLTGMLEKWGYQPVAVSDGEQAMAVLDQPEPPQIALLDWIMPGLDGLAVCQRVKHPDRPFVYVILITSKNEREEMVAGLDAGADDFITKPVQHDILRSRLAVGERILRYQQRLEESNAKLQALNAQKDAFLGMAAHDLRTPLHVVEGLSSLLMDTPTLDQGEQTEILGAIKDASRTMLTLVEELLDVTRIEQGRITLNRQWVELAPYLERVVELNRLVGRAKGVTVAWSLGAGAGGAWFDGNRVDQVLNNLIGNAIKFSEAGTTVMVWARADADGVEMAVIDQGPGVRPEERETIFASFQLGHAQPTGDERSFGLGLAICRRIVELHGGVIGVESGQEQGSRFYFRLPAERAACPES